MRFSLILATVGKTKAPEHFLHSLYTQSYQNFELIVVDQNPDDRLVQLLAAYEGEFPMLRLRAKKRGASKARNIGLEHVDGNVVAFPDDDCQYPPELLAKVARFLNAHPEEDGLTGRSIDEGSRTSMGRYDTRPGPVNKLNVWRRGIEYAIFLRADSVKGLRFDEAIGPGAGTAWGCGEGTDYLLRLLERGASLYYDPSIVVVHHQPTPPYNKHTMRRAYSYGCGMGRTLKKHRMPLLFKTKWLVRPLGGALLSLFGRRLPEAEYRWKTFRGRLRGLLS